MPEDLETVSVLFPIPIQVKSRVVVILTSECSWHVGRQLRDECGEETGGERGAGVRKMQVKTWGARISSVHSKGQFDYQMCFPGLV